MLNFLALDILRFEYCSSAIQGLGVFALEYIPKSRLIGEYVGEIIRECLTDVRERKYQQRVRLVVAVV